MSLDVYLNMKGSVRKAGSGIYVREYGSTRQITRDEWDERFPGCEPVVAMEPEEVVMDGEVYTANITHNLNAMAEEAGIYLPLWRPDEAGITKAAQLIEPLRDGLARLQANPERFKKFNPKNGWGDYDGLCSFVACYIQACEEYPDADVSVWR